MSHTPGPWDHRQGYNALKDEIGVAGKALATVWVRKMKRQKDDTNDRAEPCQEGEANARLIAAAPEMLAALELYFSNPKRFNKAASDAIKKATGK